jgi:hypothetical protein
VLVLLRGASGDLSVHPAGGIVRNLLAAAGDDPELMTQLRDSILDAGSGLWLTVLRRAVDRGEVPVPPTAARPGLSRLTTSTERVPGLRRRRDRLAIDSRLAGSPGRAACRRRQDREPDRSAVVGRRHEPPDQVHQVQPAPVIGLRLHHEPLI